MIDNLAPPTNRPTDPADLQPGDWIEREPGEALMKVQHAHLYRIGDEPVLLLICQRIGDRPRETKLVGDTMRRVRRARPDEATAAEEELQRHAIADELRELADLVLNPRVPLPAHGQVQVTFHMGDVAAVEAAAKAIHGEVRQNFRNLVEATWPVGRQPYEPGLLAEFTAYRTEAEQGEVPAGVDVLPVTGRGGAA
jgi:hypothetical protein